MTSFRQIAANRRNASKSTGPTTEEGKQRSRCNAIRHGLTAETVIGALEDAEDYKAFETAITADYDAQSAVERELVLRLASHLGHRRRQVRHLHRCVASACGTLPQAARSCLTLMSDSAGMPSPLCSRQIILSVSERLRLRTSCTRLRLPMKGIRSRGRSPFWSI